MITYAFAIAIRSLTEDTEVKHPARWLCEDVPRWFLCRKKHRLHLPSSKFSPKRWLCGDKILDLYSFFLLCTVGRLVFEFYFLGEWNCRRCCWWWWWWWWRWRWRWRWWRWRWGWWWWWWWWPCRDSTQVAAVQRKKGSSNSSVFTEANNMKSKKWWTNTIVNWDRIHSKYEQSNSCSLRHVQRDVSSASQIHIQ